MRLLKEKAADIIFCYFITFFIISFNVMIYTISLYIIIYKSFSIVRQTSMHLKFIIKIEVENFTKFLLH